MIRRCLLFSLLIPLTFSSSAYSQWDWKPDGISFGLAKENEGKKGVVSYRAGLLWDISYNVFEVGGWHLSSYLDTSINYWKSQASSTDKKGINSHSSIMAITASPIFRFSTNQQYGHISPYIEGGIGLGFGSHASLYGKKNSRIDMGSAFTFENRLAVGIMIGQNWDLSLRWYHYSNGSLHDNNEDLDFYGASLSYWF